MDFVTLDINLSIWIKMSTSHGFTRKGKIKYLEICIHLIDSNYLGNESHVLSSVNALYVDTWIGHKHT